MESVLLIINQITIMFVLMVIGFILKKRNVIHDNSIHDLTNILLYLVTPVVLLSAYCEPFSQEKAKNLFICFVISIAIHLFFILLSHLIYPKDGVAQNAILLPNSGYMGIPLVTSIFGNEAVFYLSAFMAINSLIQWTYGVYALDKNAKISLKSIITSPIIIALCASLLIFLTNIQIPSILISLMNQISNLNTPLAMILLGSFLSNISFQQVRKDIKAIIQPVVIRLLIFPLAILLILNLFPFINEQIKMIHIILSASPTAISVALFASKYKKNTLYATEIICLSTLLCIITIPLFVYLQSFIGS